MITPDTIENVSAPNLTGVWLFCKLNAYGYRKLVLARTEEAFKKSVLKCAWDIGSPAGHVGMFGMAPCEITIVSFPKERVEQAAKNIKRDQFDLLKSHVLFNARQHQKKLGNVPSGFTTGFKPKGVSSVLLYEKFYECDKKEAPTRKSGLRSKCQRMLIGKRLQTLERKSTQAEKGKARSGLILHTLQIRFQKADTTDTKPVQTWLGNG